MAYWTSNISWSSKKNKPKSRITPAIPITVIVEAPLRGFFKSSCIVYVIHLPIFEIDWIGAIFCVKEELFSEFLPPN